VTYAHTIDTKAKNDVSASLLTLRLIVVARDSSNINPFDLCFTDTAHNGRITIYFVNRIVVAMPMAFGNNVGRLSDFVVFEPKP